MYSHFPWFWIVLLQRDALCSRDDSASLLQSKTDVKRGQLHSTISTNVTKIAIYTTNFGGYDVIVDHDIADVPDGVRPFYFSEAKHSKRMQELCKSGKNKVGKWFLTNYFREMKWWNLKGWQPKSLSLHHPTGCCMVPGIGWFTMAHTTISMPRIYFLSCSNENTWRLFCMTIAISIRNVVEKAMVLSALRMIWIFCWKVVGEFREARRRWSSGEGLWRKGLKTKVWHFHTISIRTSRCGTWSMEKPTKSPTLSKRSSISCMSCNEISHWFLCICTIPTWLKLMQSPKKNCRTSWVSMLPGGTQEPILSGSPVLTIAQFRRRKGTWCLHGQHHLSDFWWDTLHMNVGYFKIF